MKKCWIISFDGLFEAGYVQIVFFKKTEFMPVGSISEALSISTKFRYKFIADIYCWVLNFISKQKCDLREYKVIEHTN